MKKLKKIDLANIEKSINNILTSLDQMLGDTDPYIPEDWDDETIKYEEPIFWIHREIVKVGNMLKMEQKSANES